MSAPTVRNATIKSTKLGFTNDHGFLDHWLLLDYGGTGQGWGGYVLGFQDGKKVLDSIAGDTIVGILNTVGADDWGALPGKSLRAYTDWGKVYGIGNYLEDKWFWIHDLGAKTGTFDDMVRDIAREAQP